MKVNPLECPHCYKRATEFYEILIGMSRFHRDKKCQYCNQKIKYNTDTLIQMVLLMIFGIVALNIIDVTLSVNRWFGKALVVLFFVTPILLGKSLFKKID